VAVMVLGDAARPSLQAGDDAGGRSSVLYSASRPDGVKSALASPSAAVDRDIAASSSVPASRLSSNIELFSSSVSRAQVIFARLTRRVVARNLAARNFGREVRRRISNARRGSCDGACAQATTLDLACR